jgi:shikimate kinase
MGFSHLALIGLMGSGKSAVGGCVARHLGLPLVDVDDEIQARTGQSVRALWEAGGEAAYRPLERRVVVEALEPGPGRVLAAPGGVVLDEVATGALRRPHVAVVYLRGDTVTLAERVSRDDQPRPLLGPDPLAALRSMEAARGDRYEGLAHRIEDIEERTPEQIATSVIDAFGRELTASGLPPDPAG